MCLGPQFLVITGSLLFFHVVSGPFPLHVVSVRHLSTARRKKGSSSGLSRLPGILKAHICNWHSHFCHILLLVKTSHRSSPGSRVDNHIRLYCEEASFSGATKVTNYLTRTALGADVCGLRVLQFLILCWLLFRDV